MRGFFATVCAAGLWAGCSFDPPPELQEDGGPIDASRPDAIVLACEPDTIVCDDANGRYVECGSDGTSTRVIECPLGCAADAEKCVDIDPSNGLATYLDLLRAGDDAGAVTFTGNSTIDTTTGIVTNNGTQIAVPSDDTGAVRVLMFRELAIAGVLKVTGERAVAFVVDGDVEIMGLVDVSADAYTRGPGALVGGAATCAGEGTPGFAGGGARPGGGGGGRYDVGGQGGGADGSTSGYAGGPMLRDPDIVELRGGCSGGSTTELVSPEPTYSGSAGGGGGGAVQIVSTTQIRVIASGRIDASGGGGGSGTATPYTVAGGGGGAGGAILIEAPVVVLDGPGVVLSTKGGGGGAAATTSGGRPGADGGLDEAPAAGGVWTLVLAANGGDGGTSAAAPQPGEDGATGADGAGGGGSVGETRLNDLDSDVPVVNGAAIRSRSSTGAIQTRQIP